MPHTPGPWCVDATKTLGAYGVWTDYGDHKGHDGTLFPSQVCSVLRDGIARADDIDRRNANARLIAAAPDLLAACKAALGTLDIGNDARPIVLAAIAKACGNQSTTGGQP